MKFLVAGALWGGLLALLICSITFETYIGIPFAVIGIICLIIDAIKEKSHD